MKKNFLFISIVAVLMLAGCASNPKIEEKLEPKPETKSEYKPPMQESIFDAKWLLRRILIDGAAYGVTGNASVEFLDEGIAHVYTGINIFNARYELDEKAATLSFQEGPMTLATGSPEETRIEQALVSNLLDCKKYSCDGNLLILLDSLDAIRLVFERE